MSEVLLSVQDLHTAFKTDKGEVQAVNGISFATDLTIISHNPFSIFLLIRYLYIILQ